MTIGTINTHGEPSVRLTIVTRGIGSRVGRCGIPVWRTGRVVGSEGSHKKGWLVARAAIDGVHDCEIRLVEKLRVVRIISLVDVCKLGLDQAWEASEPIRAQRDNQYIRAADFFLVAKMSMIWSNSSGLARG